MTRAAFRPAEVAARWACSRGHVYRMLRSREVRGFKVGKDWRIPADEVDRIESGASTVPVGNAPPAFTNPWDSP